MGEVVHAGRTKLKPDRITGRTLLEKFGQEDDPKEWVKKYALRLLNGPGPPAPSHNVQPAHIEAELSSRIDHRLACPLYFDLFANSTKHS
jgi:hypothetical protein